mmetsp:Transcript_47252/g.119809  ORF Transcript_47252/g.119809 Transcript_47252/m.119809 type:complete len:141 (+) Transcript_47252:120-542(+)
MGSAFSNIHDQEEGHAWDVQWSQLERGAAPAVQLAPSDLLLLDPHHTQRSDTAKTTYGAHCQEKVHSWDLRWIELEQDLALEIRREAMVAKVQKQLYQLPTILALDRGKGMAANAKELNKGACAFGGETVVLTAVRAAGA